MIGTLLYVCMQFYLTNKNKNIHIVYKYGIIYDVCIMYIKAMILNYLYYNI